MTRSTTEIDQAALREQDDVLAVHGVLVHLGLDVVMGRAMVCLQPRHVNLVVEVADVANDGLVLHGAEMGRGHDVLVAGGGHHDVGLGTGIHELLHLIALHRSLKRANGIDLADDHTATGLAQALGGTLAHITESCNASDLARHHDVRGTADGIHAGLTATILVVELALGDTVIHVDGRHRERAILFALIQTEHTRCRLLTDALDASGELRMLVQDHVREVAPIVQDHVQGLAIGSEEQGLLNAPFVFLLGHAFPSVDRNPCSSNGGGSVVLRGEDVAAGPCHVSTELLEGLDEHCSLNGHVQTTCDARTGKGLFIPVTVAKGHETRHFSFCQLNFLAAPFGEVDVLDLVGQCSSGIGDAHAFFLEFGAKIAVA